MADSLYDRMEALQKIYKHGPIVYRLGRILLKDKSRVRLSVGSPFSASTRTMFNYLLSKVKDFGLIDKIYSRKDEDIREQEIGSKEYKRIEIRNENIPTWVCFLPWRVTFEDANRLGLIPKNGKVIAYEGPIGFANPNPTVAVELLEKIVEDLKSLKLNNFNILSLSIGAYPGFYIANHFNVNKLVAVTPGSKLGASIYKGIATWVVKEKAMSLGFLNGEQYDSLMGKTNPIENLDNLPDDIEVHIATHDFYIPTVYGEELISALKNKNKSFNIIKYKGKGHILTMVQFGKNNPY